MMLESFKLHVLPLKNKLFRFAYSMVEDHDLAKEVVQETMIKAWEKRDEMDLVKNMEAWCMTVTRHYALDKLRSKHHKTLPINQDVEYVYNEQSPYQLTEMGNTMEAIDKIVRQLPPKQKEAFHLRDIEGYSYQEITEITGFGLNDVKINIFRARKTIKSSLLKLNTHGLEKSRNAS